MSRVIGRRRNRGGERTMKTLSVSKQRGLDREDPMPRSLWDEDFHDRLTRQMDARWAVWEEQRRLERVAMLLERYGTA